MGVRREGNRGGVWQIQFARDMPLRFTPDGSHHFFPFVIGQRCSVLPGLNLAIQTRVRPKVVAMRGEMQPVRSGAKCLGE